MGLDPVDYATWKAGQLRILRFEEWKERQFREALAADPIVALMRRLEACDTQVRFVDVDTSDDSDLPFSDAREIRE